MTLSYDILPADGCFLLHHQGKSMLTPGRNLLKAPTLALAQAIAAEWKVLGDQKPSPSALPLTGFAALAEDVITPYRTEIIEELLEYGETDLLCYREAEDNLLIQLQQQHWQPWLEWARQHYGTEYILIGGVMPQRQPAANRQKHYHAIHALNNFQLACLAAIVKPTTSLILGLAFMAHALDAETLYHLSRLEESHNIGRWGEEAEAAAHAAALFISLKAAQQWRDGLNIATSARQ